MSYGVKVHVWGDRACFTRPEMKVERVSYDVMTPSAARGIMEAIYWKPSIRWVIDRIHVLRPIQFENIRRNEVASKISERNISATMKDPTKSLFQFIESDRQQRAAMVLRDVAYVIEAHFEATDADGENVGKHLDIVNRRIQHGQCFHQPYFGCREFPVSFESVTDTELKPISESRDLGWMLYDMHFGPKDEKGNQVISPMFFHANLREGAIDVPPPSSDEVKR
ncbi:MAG: type I-C CRISPR-associated protein Cas5 [Deltaproteobacteria bacterium]|nr:type I-C CRISPR-associated protein Cas5 [Deltaproteobacteria bacterium]